MPFGIGVPELIIILVVVLLLFGAGRLPQLGNAMGKSIREFKRGMAGEDDQKPAAAAPTSAATEAQTAPKTDAPASADSAEATPAAPKKEP
jgi:sec-independent protein translocase protein TatA